MYFNYEITFRTMQKFPLDEILSIIQIYNKLYSIYRKIWYNIFKLKAEAFEGKSKTGEGSNHRYIVTKKDFS